MKNLLLVLLCLPMIGLGQTNTLGFDIVSPNSKIKEVFSGGEGTKNKPFFYIYDDGTVEKRIILE
ncbi:MAG: hypothetical protein VX347_00075 [Bacteroidota bacterium]|nr:hypothetical protein [Bacteroidota bacterium]